MAEIKIPKINAKLRRRESSDEAENKYALHINAFKGVPDSDYYAVMLKNPQLDMRDDNGWSALMYASAANNYAIVRLLLIGVRTEGISGADINLQNPEGRTPLMLAANKGHVLVVKELLAYHPNLSVKDENGKTAYEVTTRDEVKRLLFSPGSCRACSSNACCVS